MSQRKSTVFWSTLVGLGLCISMLLSVGIGQSKPPLSPEKLLPATTILYLGWDGIDAHRQAWQATAAYKAICESGLSDLIERLIDFGIKSAGDDAEKVQLSLQSAEHVWKKGFSLAVSVPSAEGPPFPRLTLVVPGAGTVINQIGELLKELPAGAAAPEFSTEKIGSRTVTHGIVPNSPGVEIGWWAEGSHLLVVAGIGAVQSAIAVAEGKTPHLGTTAAWKKYRGNKLSAERALVSWVDFASIRKLTGEFPIPRQNGEEPLTVNQLLEELSLDELGILALQWGFKGPSLWREVSLENPASHRAEVESFTLDELPPLPEVTDGFYASRIDWSNLYERGLKIGSKLLADFSPETPLPETLLAQFQEQLGIDFKVDLLEPLGDLTTLYGDSRQGMFGTGIGLVVKVDDAATLRATIAKLLEQLVATVGPDVEIQHTDRSDREVTYLEFPNFPIFTPAVTVDDDWLIIGLYPQTVYSCLLRLDGKLPKWEPTGSAAEALAELPEQFTSISVSDPRSAIHGLMTMTPMFISFAKLGAKQSGSTPIELPVTTADFPPAEAVSGPLFINVAVSTADDEGIRWISRSSLPSASLFGGGLSAGGASAPVLVALLLPAVQQARAAARRSQSKNNLKMFGLALHNYHDANGNFPEGTRPNKDLKPDLRLSWLVGLLPYLDQAALFNQLDVEQGWDAEANATAMSNRVPAFQNPEIPLNAADKNGVTHYVGIGGLGRGAEKADVKSKRAGAFGYNRTVRIADVTDGLSNTMGVAEAGKDFGAWGAGGNSTIRSLTAKPYIDGPDGIGNAQGANVLLLDGSVRFISKDVDPSVLEAMSTIAGGEVVEIP